MTLVRAIPCYTSAFPPLLLLRGGQIAATSLHSLPRSLLFPLIRQKMLVDELSLTASLDSSVEAYTALLKQLATISSHLPKVLCFDLQRP
jgi:hypothetical protein